MEIRFSDPVSSPTVLFKTRVKISSLHSRFQKGEKEESNLVKGSCVYRIEEESEFNITHGEQR